MRARGQEESATTSVPEGSAVFVPALNVQPPEEDAKVFQSFRLHLAAGAENEAEADSALPGVTAFSREVSSLWNKNEEELAEVRTAMLKAEGCETLDSEDEILDDFLLSATQDNTDQATPTLMVPRHRQPPAGVLSHIPDEEADDLWGSDDSCSDREEGADAASSSPSSVLDRASGASAGPASQSQRPAKAPGSIASTYWRTERKDRNANLSAIDERFEQLALGYNSDELGELDDEDDTVQGSHALDQYGPMMNDFLAVHATAEHAHEGGQHYDAPDCKGPQPAISDEAAAAIAKARESLRAAEERPEPPTDRGVQHWDDDAADGREHWDCESVLTTLSNLDNHPGRIMEPSRRRGQPKQQAAHRHIQLSAKTGLPVAHRTTSEPGSVYQAERHSRDEKLQPQKHHRGETGEEKKARKALVKEARRKARANKKELKVMFKDEAQRQSQPGVSASTVPLS
ncbi:hypothetical protein WJX73_005942 [Symbiochloris irregularis]|uniref:Protein LTV1 homolog n=1 Tax=Symbiochloris irregularis TaxID=706552 RepID=A0AAW1P280_9CHLO